MIDNLPEIIDNKGSVETKNLSVLRHLKGRKTSETQYRQGFNYF